MLEKGRFTPAAELPLRERQSFEEMYEMGSLMTTQDAGAHTCSYLQSSLFGSTCHTRKHAKPLLPPHCTACLDTCKATGSRESGRS